MAQTYEFRCPIHGFIAVDEWEREIIEHPVFQRLRRIRQLGWTDYVYPGAMHTRFEHSLGVMHVATRLFDSIVSRSKDVLSEAFKYVSFERHQRIVRLAALLHDLGHGPFSHAGEGLLPRKADGKPYKHEAYSAAIVRGPLKNVLEDHPINQSNYHVRAEEVAALLENSSQAAGIVFWREIIDSQLDADRMDYLLRDSHHLGVQYGSYDLDRLVNTVCAVPGKGDTEPRIGVAEGGWHAAESLVLARYYMFTQVYFHKTRVAYDHHIVEAMRELLPGGRFPRPDADGLPQFLRWDDWRVLGLLADGQGGEHAERIAQRNHFRKVYQTTEHPEKEDLQRLQEQRDNLGALLRYETTSSKSWYAPDKQQIRVDMEDGAARDLTTLSLPVANIGGHQQTFLYVDRNDVPKAARIFRGTKDE